MARTLIRFFILSFDGLLRQLGRRFIQIIFSIIDLNTFVAFTLRDWLVRFSFKRAPFSSMLVPQIIYAGIDALFIMAFLGLIVGLAIIFRLIVLLDSIANTETISRLLVDLIALELNPLVCAIALASRSGTAITVDIGNMVIHKEIKSLERLGININDLFVFPYLLAITTSQMILSLFFSSVSLISGILVSGFLISVNRFELLSEVANSISALQFFGFILKNAAFGLSIAAIAAFNGLQVKVSPMEVSRQTQRTMSQSLVIIFIIDALFALVLL